MAQGHALGPLGPKRVGLCLLLLIAEPLERLCPASCNVHRLQLTLIRKRTFPPQQKESLQMSWPKCTRNARFFRWIALYSIVLIFVKLENSAHELLLTFGCDLPVRSFQGQRAARFSCSQHDGGSRGAGGALDASGLRLVLGGRQAGAWQGCDPRLYTVPHQVSPSC